MPARAWILAAAVVATAGCAQAASREVQYGPRPAWVTASPTPTAAPPPEGAPARIIYTDSQVRLGEGADETYTAYRLKILTPEALAAGKIAATWSPSADDIIVHELKIIRGDGVIDVLAANKFQVIQRENNLDYSMLDGELTAVLETPGLQVGDELEFAATIRRRDPTLGDRSHGFLQLPLVGAPGAYRLRLIWPDGKTARWRATPDLGAIRVNDHDGRHELTYELRDPKSVVVADGAPGRVNLRRLVEYSAFSGWADVSRLLSPLFDRAATLAPNSPVRLEAAKIASATRDPAQRVEAALQLVQDRVRYVYVGLDGGNYRPANADDTWNRRFGDCKAKTALLIALLRELGIPSEAVLVNSAGGDGTDRRLPTPAVFDHVLVRATVGGKPYWLDGTRLGDRRLAALPRPSFRWALPLRAEAVDLETVSAEAPDLPQSIMVEDVDASAGFGVPAKVSAEQVLRGDDMLQLRTQLSSLPHEDAERAVKAYWRRELSWAEPTTAAWRYDELQKLMVLSMSGEGKLGWEGDDQDGRSLDIDGAGFTPPSEFHRPKEQDQDAPWLTDFPAYKCWVTSIKLPPETAKWRWDYAAGPVNTHLGGIAYWRVASLQGGVMRTIMSKKTYLAEISAAEARDVNQRLPSFDNNISRVFQSKATEQTSEAHLPAAPAAWAVPMTAHGPDWSSPVAPCSLTSPQH